MYPDLFQTKGTDWDLRAAVLLSFAGGAGFAGQLLKRYRNELAKQPEELRWDLLGGKPMGASGKVRDDDRYKNVQKKMDLAAKLGYHPL